MRTIKINIKYNVGDKVWVMVGSYPTKLEIIKIIIVGGSEDESGASSDFGRVYYRLSNRDHIDYTEEQLCDTFKQLRDKVFNKYLENQ